MSANIHSIAAGMKETMADGLPRQFISSLRILFDILDETRSGYIRFQDIEARWSDDGVRGLPPGVIDSLRNVASPSGFLSFDRFVEGLKLVLTSQKREPGSQGGIVRSYSSKENRIPMQEHNSHHQRDVNGNQYKSDTRFVNRHTTPIINNVSNTQQNSSSRQRPPYQQPSVPKKTTDYPDYGDSHFESQLPPRGHRKSPPIQTSTSSSGTRLVSQNAYVIKPEVSSYPNSVGSHHAPAGSVGTMHQVQSSVQPQERDRVPAIPPRSDRPNSSTAYTTQMKKSLSGPNLVSHSHLPPTLPPRGERHKSSWMLNDWQRDWVSSQNHERKNGQDKNSIQAKDIYANIDQFRQRVEDVKQRPQKSSVQRHNSGRRHTLANGIDQNMFKRMKQLEEAAAMLQSGMAMVDSAKEWYLQQLAAVSDKQAMLGKVTYNDNSVEAYQERMNFQRARIAEINQHLQTLLESSEKGFPIHMNLELATSKKPADNLTVQSLRDQNKRLMEEVAQTKEHIAQLEREKASLVRDLFEARSLNKSSHDDTTFM